MRAYIILGNTREKSNTKALAKVFADELTAKGIETTVSSLIGKNINTCVGCEGCHENIDSFGCVIDDEMQEIAKEILSADLVVFASPIYTWMPTPPLKALMDRFYAFTKHLSPDLDLGNDQSFNLLKKQKIAMLATSADKCETNCDLFDEALRRMAAFAKIPYLGYVAACDFDTQNTVTPEASKNARSFAEKCAAVLEMDGKDYD